MDKFGLYIIPAIICGIILYGFIKKINVFDAFGEGVKLGAGSVASIFPTLFALFIAISVLRASGLVDFIAQLMSPICSYLHFPSGLLPFALLRPVSGSGSLAMAADLFSAYGPDSFEGRLASVMMGSTETTFYTIAVYFGACKIKNIRYTLKTALFADLFSVVMSVIICLWYF